MSSNHLTHLTVDVGCTGRDTQPTFPAGLKMDGRPGKVKENDVP